MSNTHCLLTMKQNLKSLSKSKFNFTTMTLKYFSEPLHFSVYLTRNFSITKELFWLCKFWQNNFDFFIFTTYEIV